MVGIQDMGECVTGYRRYADVL